MGKQIKKVYIIHHSHTDIGYTDLQEQVIYNQIHNIKKVITLLKRGYEANLPEKELRWNCETYYCVEQFLKTASEEERQDFIHFVKKGNIGFPLTTLTLTILWTVAGGKKKLLKCGIFSCGRGFS